MDEIDRKILAELQRDATLPVAEIAHAAGISTSPCWRRIQRLEQAGIIQGRVALLDPERMNVAVTVFVSIRTRRHDAQWAQDFAQAVAAIDEVLEFHRMSGDVDYLLRVVVPDIAAYDRIYKRLIQIPGLRDVSSSFSMEQIKYTTALPTGYVVAS